MEADPEAVWGGISMDDLISRKAAIEAIKTWGLIDGLSEGQAIEILADEEKLPSAQPEKVYVDEIMIDAEMFQRTVERIAEKTRKELDLQILGGE